jgi:hypothetical protein
LGGALGRVFSDCYATGLGFFLNNPDQKPPLLFPSADYDLASSLDFLSFGLDGVFDIIENKIL